MKIKKIASQGLLRDPIIFHVKVLRKRRKVMEVHI